MSFAISCQSWRNWEVITLLVSLYGIVLLNVIMRVSLNQDEFICYFINRNCFIFTYLASKTFIYWQTTEVYPTALFWVNSVLEENEVRTIHALWNWKIKLLSFWYLPALERAQFNPCQSFSGETSQKQTRLWAECATSVEQVCTLLWRGSSHMTCFAPVADDDHVACIPTLVVQEVRQLKSNRAEGMCSSWWNWKEMNPKVEANHHNHFIILSQMIVSCFIN